MKQKEAKQVKKKRKLSSAELSQGAKPPDSVASQLSFILDSLNYRLPPSLEPLVALASHFSREACVAILLIRMKRELQQLFGQRMKRNTFAVLIQNILIVGASLQMLRSDTGSIAADVAHNHLARNATFAELIGHPMCSPPVWKKTIA